MSALSTINFVVAADRQVLAPCF